MKIIDAHLHLFEQSQSFHRSAQAVGHEYSGEHLKSVFDELGIVHGVVMGNRTLDPESHCYPDFLSYCIGLDSSYLACHSIAESLPQLEKHLASDRCVGIKLYPGYWHAYVTDPCYEPVLRLADHYRKPVAIHTGTTVGTTAVMKYSHPLTVDELAVRWPKVQFILCHFGNPWLVDAAAVLEKNRNVAADLSGLLAGRVDLDAYYRDNARYVEQLRTWIDYLESYDALLYGTDWPLVNMAEYRDFIARLIPERYYEKVFYENAKRIYHLPV